MSGYCHCADSQGRELAETGEHTSGNLRGGSGSHRSESLKSVTCEAERAVTTALLPGGMGMEEGVVSKL